MANESTPASTDAKPSQPGPDLLAERSLAGIFVHLSGVGTWFLVPGLVYLVSEHEFTRANARNAVNWQVFHALALAVVYGAAGAVAGVDAARPGGLPDGLGTGLVLTLGAGVTALAVIFVLNLAFVLAATVKAAFGTAWAYPIAPDAVGRLRSATGDGSGWWALVVAYALVAPVVFAHVGWLALGNDVAFWPFFVLLVATVLASPLVAVALYRDARRLRATGANWEPTAALYLGFALAVGALTYLARAVLFVSENPAGDGVYGFMAGLWVAAVVYTLRRRHRVGTP